MLINYSNNEIKKLFHDANYELMICNCYVVIFNKLNRRCIQINDYSLKRKLENTMNCIDENTVDIKKSSSSQFQSCIIEKKKENSIHDLIQSCLKIIYNWKFNIIILIVSIAISLLVFRFYLEKT